MILVKRKQTIGQTMAENGCAGSMDYAGMPPIFYKGNKNSPRVLLSSPHIMPRFCMCSIKGKLHLLRKGLLQTILFAGFAAMPVFYGCEADKVSYDSSRMLVFSVDTIAFDTIFTDEGSATKMFKIYNRVNNQLIISSIKLSDGSNFHINVDGTKADMFEDVLINAKDSMMIFVQVTIDPKDSSLPFLVKDSIQFVTNGNRQKVMLEAYGQEAVRMNKVTVRSDSMLTPELPFLINDTFRVAESVTLKISAGCRLYFRKNALMYVDGTVLSEGTIAENVEFRGDRSDYMNTVPPLSYDRASAQWGGIVFSTKSRDNHFVYTDIRNSTFGLVLDSTSTEKNTFLAEYCMIRNASGNLITAVNAKMSIYNSLVYNAGGYLLNLSGGEYEFCHDTFVNYYSYSWGGRTLPIAVMRNFSGQNPIAFSMLAANCIFYGNYNNELTYETSPYGEETFSYSYKNCIVKLLGSNINQCYENCLVNTPPLFEFEAWSDEFADANPHLYDLHLQKESPAIGVGDVSTAVRFPYDLDGNARLDGSNPCIGAYEYLYR